MKYIHSLSAGLFALWFASACTQASKQGTLPNPPLGRMAEGPLGAEQLDSAQCLLYQTLDEPCFSDLAPGAGDTILRLHYQWSFEESVLYTIYKYAPYKEYVVIRKVYNGPMGEAGVSPGARRPVVNYQASRQQYPLDYGLPTACLSALAFGPELRQLDIDGEYLVYEMKTEEGYFRRRLNLNEAANKDLWRRFQEYYPLGK